MTNYTWDGLRLFKRIETAATHALDENKTPNKLKVLVEGGQLEPAAAWEIKDLIMHMRDQAPPL